MPDHNSWENLSDKVVLVTGAGRGIGRGLAEAFGKEGATVVCASRTIDDLQEVVSVIESRGGHGLAVPTDVTDPDSVEKLFQTVERELGALDILFINAGGSLAKADIASSGPELWGQTIELNLVGAYHCARYAVPLLKERGGGKIITIGSGMGHRGVAGNSAYCCAKAGLWMLTRVLAQELEEFSISVNELIPGPVVTGKTRDMASSGSSVFGVQSEWVKEPADVVPLALFLARQPLRGPTAQSYSLMRRDN